MFYSPAWYTGHKDVWPPRAAPHVYAPKSYDREHQHYSRAHGGRVDGRTESGPGPRIGHITS